MSILSEKEIDSIEEFDALISPRRLQLAEHFREPATVRSAAEKLGVPVTRLYYHVNVMLEHGLLHVVEERKAGAMTERVFQTAARSFRPSAQFLERYGTEGLLEVVRLTFVEAEQELRRAVDEGVASLEQDDLEQVVLGYSSMRMSEENLRKLVKEINEILAGIEDDPDGIVVRGLIALFPKAGQ